MSGEGLRKLNAEEPASSYAFSGTSPRERGAAAANAVWIKIVRDLERYGAFPSVSGSDSTGTLGHRS